MSARAEYAQAMTGSTADSSRLTASMAVRPARVAVLVPKVEGWSWLAMFEGALAAQGRCWGGSANLLFPLSDDLTDNDVFWELADRFDADMYVAYSPVYADVQEILPDLHKSFIDRQRARFTSEHGAETAERLVGEIAKHRAIEGQVGTVQLEPIRRRLAPFYNSADNWLLPTVSGSSSPPWPLMDATSFADLPSEVSSSTTTRGLAARLVLTANIGRLTADTRDALRKRDITVIDETIGHPLPWAQAAVDRWRAEHPVSAWALSNWGLAPYRSGGVSPGISAVVVGDTPWDFVLFYALKRMTGQAWWLPSWLRRNRMYMWRLTHALEFAAPQQGREVAVVSVSSGAARRQAAEDLRSTDGKPLAGEVTDWRTVLPDRPLRLFERDNQGRNQPLDLANGATLALATPIPKHVGTPRPTDMHWITEVQGAQWTPVRHPALGTRLIDASLYTSEQLRTTRDGLAYMCPNVMIFGGEGLESVVVRPNVRPMPLLGQLQGILKPLGWRAELSDKGIYATECATLFGGVGDLVSALRDPPIRALLDAYIAKQAPGQFLSHDNRRYLSWKNLTELRATGTDGIEQAVLFGLLASGVLERGLILQCQRCRQKVWYHLDNIGTTFVCNRCRLGQAVEPGWGPGDEPVWFYRLAEVLYQFLKNNGDLPVLGVHDQFGDSGHVDQSYELDLFPPHGKGWEMDILVSAGCRLWIGEATKTGNFDEDRLKKVAHLANLVDAYGVLLITSKASWPTATQAATTAAFSGRWPQFEMVAGVK
jgi:hypothetical protein